MASILNVQELQSSSGILSTEQNIRVSFQNTDSYLILPQGSTAERYQSVSEGAIRWNTDFDQLEVFDGDVWRLSRRIYDYDLIIGLFPLSLDSSNNLKSYPGFGRKWFNSEFETYKALFSENPTFNSSNKGFIEFNGTSTYSTIAINSRLTPTSSISQECWFKTNNNTKAQSFIALQYGISTNNSYALGIANSQWIGGVNIAGVFENITHPFSSTPLNNNQWYNFVHTYNSETFSFESEANIQTGSNILEIVSGNFDFIVGMTITGSGIPVDQTDPANPIYTTITSIDTINNRITLSDPATSSSDGVPITCSLPPHQILYINGEIVNKLPFNGTIEYTVDNDLVTIGGDFNGPGANTGIDNLFDGAISIVRIGSFFNTPSVVKNNFDVIKARYGY